MIEMVTFKLVEETDEQLVFRHYPEGHEDKRHGVIVVDRIKEEIDITELAKEDWERDREAYPRRKSA